MSKLTDILLKLRKETGETGNELIDMLIRELIEELDEVSKVYKSLRGGEK